MGRVGRAVGAPTSRSGALSALVAVGLVAAAVASAGDLAVNVVALGGVALLLLAVGLVTGAGLAIGGAVVGVAACGIVGQVPAAALYALGLLVVAEGALWSADDRHRPAAPPGLRSARLRLLGVLGGAAVALGAALRLLARVGGEPTPAYTAVAAASIVALVGLIVLSALRRQPPR